MLPTAVPSGFGFNPKHEGGWASEGFGFIPVDAQALARAPGCRSEGAWLPGIYQQKFPLLNRDRITFLTEEEIGRGEGCVQVVPWSRVGCEG